MNNRSDKDLKTNILNLALGEGIKYGAVSTLVGGIVLAVSQSRSEWFNKSFNTSAKTSIPVMACLAGFSIGYEVTMVNAERNPERWGLVAKNEKVEESLQAQKPIIPFHHWILNFFYGNNNLSIKCIGIKICFVSR